MDPTFGDPRSANPEFSSEMLIAALFANCIRALGARGQGDIGVSFPDVNVNAGNVYGFARQCPALQES